MQEISQVHTRLTRRSFLKLMAVLAGQAFLTGASGMAYATTYEPSWIQVTRLELKLARLGRAFDGFRLAQISDLHMGAWMNAERLSSILDQVLAESPDLLAVTGDFIEYETDPASIAATMADLVACFSALGDLPRLGVLGNHDIKTSASQVRRMMADSSILDLTNRVHTLRRGDDLLHVAGVDDLRRGRPDLRKVLAALPPADCAILLSHEPDFADESAATGRFDLQISGHTHGGQVSLPFIGPPLLPEGGRKYVDGLYQVGNMLQYTNRGVGMTFPFVRFNARPEITIFTLRSA